MDFELIAKRAKQASLEMAELTVDIKNEALLQIAKGLENNYKSIIDANRLDLESAKENVSESVFNRLKLDENKMRDMIQGIVDIYELEDPIGKVLLQRSLDTGLILENTVCLTPPLHHPVYFNARLSIPTLS